MDAVLPFPRGFRAVALIASAYVILPLVVMAGTVPWSRIGEILSRSDSVHALELSARTSLLAMLVILVAGTPLAFLLSRTWKGVDLLRGLVTLPVAMPPVVAGMALLVTFSPRGFVGKYFDAAGISIAFTTTAVVLAQVFVAMPFYIGGLEAALRALPPGYALTAAGLGARPWRIFFRITLPLVSLSLVRAASLAFARCLGEFGATLTFAGSMEGITRTLPLDIYLQREVDHDAALVLGILLLAVALLAVLISGMCANSRLLSKVRRSNDGLVTPIASGDELIKNVHSFVKLREKFWSKTSLRTGSRAITVRVHVPERSRAISAHLQAGIHTVMGSNGVGKSTFAQVLAGWLCYEGTVTLGDDVFTTEPPYKRSILLADQGGYLFEHMTALGNVIFAVGGLGRPQRQQLAIAALRLVGMEDLAKVRVRDMSGGQRGKVALARALVRPCALLILDEPLAAMDPSSRTAAVTLLAQFAEASEQSMMMITHSGEEFAAMRGYHWVMGRRESENGQHSDEVLLLAVTQGKPTDGDWHPEGDKAEQQGG